MGDRIIHNNVYCEKSSQTHPLRINIIDAHEVLFILSQLNSTFSSLSSSSSILPFDSCHSTHSIPVPTIHCLSPHIHL